MFGFLIGPYGIGHLRASFEEILDLTKAVLATMVVVLVPVCVASPILVPRSVPVTGAALALMTMFSMRLAVRSWKIRRRPTDGKRRMVVFGAGEGGRLLLHALTRDTASSYAPVALLDDSPLKQRLTIEGVPVKGTRAGLEEVGVRVPRRHPRHRRAVGGLGADPRPHRASRGVRAGHAGPPAGQRAGRRRPRPPTCATSTSPTCWAASRSSST